MSPKSCVARTRLQLGVSALALAGALFTTAAFAQDATTASTAKAAQPAKVTSAPAAQASATQPAAPGAPAQPPSTSPIETITVTAQFRKENVQRVPIAITAVNAAMLEARGQQNVVDVAAQAPNVSLQEAGQAFGASLVAFIRGVGQTDFNFAEEPGVGVYVDDVYYATITGNVLDLLDLDRVEVERGPQGTLNGRNSIGGAIRLFTKTADGNGGGFVQGTYGSFNRVDFRGGADFTVVPDKLFVRIAGASRNRDGYVTNLDYSCAHRGTAQAAPANFPSLNVGQDCVLGHEGGQAYTSGRVAVNWVAADNFDVRLAFDMVNDQSQVQAGVLRVADPTRAAYPIFFDANGDHTPDAGDVFYDNRFITSGPNAGDQVIHNPYVSYANYLDLGQGPINPNPANVGSTTMPAGCSTVLDLTTFAGGVLWPCTNALAGFKPVVVPPINHYKSWGVSSNIDWQALENLQIQSISAWRYYTNTFANDDDASPLAVQELLQTLKHIQWSEELRFNGNLFNKFLDYTLGGFYMRQFGTLHARVDLPYTGFDFIHGPDTTPSINKALFATLTAHPTDKLTVSAGTRFSEDIKAYTFHRHNPDGTLPTAPCGVLFDPLISPDPQVAGGWLDETAANCAVFDLDGRARRFSSKRWDYRAVVDYQWTPDFMTYGQISTGYKGGGINPRPFVVDQILPFRPETLTAYEAGFKSTWFDRIRFNAAYFYNVYKAVQLQQTDCSAFSTSPVCLLPINAGDAHVQGVEFEAEGHFFDGLEVDASYSYLHFKYNRLIGSGTGITTGMVSPYTPSVKWSIGTQWEFQLPSGWGSVTPRFDVHYQSHVFTLAANNPLNRIDGYDLENLHLTWKSEDDTWSAAAEVTNLADKFYFLSLNDLESPALGAAGFVSGQPGRPREFSFTVKRKF
ncbi:MAG: TonB-dependent receptor plug domain-containing protein [Alphaproteobacteria bacterium]